MREREGKRFFFLTLFHSRVRKDLSHLAISVILHFIAANTSDIARLL